MSPRALKWRLRGRVSEPADEAPSPLALTLGELFDERWPNVDEAQVVVLGPPEATAELERAVRAARPRARVHALAERERDRLHVELAALGRSLLVIDLAPSRRRPKALVDVLLHLEPGGVLVVRPREGHDGSALVAELRQRFGALVGETSYRRGFLLVENRRLAFAKVREEQAADLLRLAPSLGRVLHTLPALEHRSPGTIAVSESDHPQEFPTAWSVPSLAVREYHDVVSTPGQILTAGAVILPDSYRHWQHRALRHDYAPNLTPRYADVSVLPRFATPPEGGEPRRLSGSYFYLDDEFRGHFGHMTTEVVSRLWAWDEAKRADPGLKALMHFNKKRHLARWEVDLLGAYGIAEEDIEFTYDPVRVERLVAATPMFENPNYAHPGLAEVWGRIGARLAAQSSVDVPERIFISRRIKKRPCRNLPDVEQFFADQGFTVLFPEDHSLADQVRIFRDTEVVAGFIGSGLFNLMFAGAPKPVLIVASESYTGKNEALIAGVLGHDLHIAWSRSEGEWVGDRFARGDYHAGFTVDLEREGAFLRDAIAAL